MKAVSDRVTVLRHGKSISTHATQDVSEADIARDMVGREVFLTGRKGSRVRASGEPLISLDRVSMTNAAGRLLLAAVSFEVGAGEVFGIAGVDGNGQTELAEAIAGLRDIQGGTISLHGRDVTALSVAERQDAGLGLYSGRSPRPWA